MASMSSDVDPRIYRRPQQPRPDATPFQRELCERTMAKVIEVWKREDAEKGPIVWPAGVTPFKHYEGQTV
jgi:hypothetical protein